MKEAKGSRSQQRTREWRWPWLSPPVPCGVSALHSRQPLSSPWESTCWTLGNILPLASWGYTAQAVQTRGHSSDKDHSSRDRPRAERRARGLWAPAGRLPPPPRHRAGLRGHRDGGQRGEGKPEARDRRRESPFGPRACGVRPASIPVPGHQDTDLPPATSLKLDVCPVDPLGCPPTSLRPRQPPAVLCT